MQSLWSTLSSTPYTQSTPSSSPATTSSNGNIRFRLFESRDALNAAYWTNPVAVPHAVLFHLNEFGYLRLVKFFCLILNNKTK